MKVGHSEFHLQGHLGPLRPLSHRAQHWAHRVRHALGGPPAPPRTAGGTNPNPWRMLEVQTPASMATKLCELVRQGDPDRLRRALNSPVADPNRPDANGDCAQSVAIRTGNLQMLTIVLDDPRVNPGHIDRQRPLTALIDALEHGSDEIVNALLDRSDVDPTLVDWQMRRPYEVAAASGRLPALRRLLLPASGPQGQSQLSGAARHAAANHQPQVLLFVLDKADDNTRHDIIDRLLYQRNTPMLQAIADSQRGLSDRGLLAKHFLHVAKEQQWNDALRLYPLLPPGVTIATDVLKKLFTGPLVVSKVAARYILVARHGSSYLDRIESSTEEGRAAAQRTLLSELRGMDPDTLAVTLACLLPAAAQAYDLGLTEDSAFVQELLRDVPDAPAIAAEALRYMRTLDLLMVTFNCGNLANVGYPIVHPDWRIRERSVCAAPLVNALMRIAGDPNVRPKAA